MNKKPIIYNQDINKNNTNKKYCYVRKEEDIREDINNIFDSLGPIYNKKVRITTQEKELDTYLMKKDENYIFTYQNEKISISDIISIKRIS